MVTWRPDSERAPSGRFNISMTLLNTRLLQVQVKPKGAPVLVDQRMCRWEDTEEGASEAARQCSRDQ